MFNKLMTRSSNVMVPSRSRATLWGCHSTLVGQFFLKSFAELSKGGCCREPKETWRQHSIILWMCPLKCGEDTRKNIQLYKGKQQVFKLDSQSMSWVTVRSFPKTSSMCSCHSASLRHGPLGSSVVSASSEGFQVTLNTQNNHIETLWRINMVMRLSVWFWFGGHKYSRTTPGSVLMEHLAVLRRLYGCLELNLDWPCIWQVPYLLYYISCPKEGMLIKVIVLRIIVMLVIMLMARLVITMAKMMRRIIRDHDDDHVSCVLSIVIH